MPDRVRRYARRAVAGDRRWFAEAQRMCCRMSGSFAIRMRSLPPRLHLKDRVLVDSGAHRAVGENPVRRDPGEGFLVHLLRVGLEDKPLARAPAPGVDLVAEAQRKFLAVIMGIEVGPQ